MAGERRRAEAGFSLIEVLIVTGLLAAGAYVALSTVEQDTGRIRLDLTEQRLAGIRRAMIGEPGLSVNGAPVVSGYVADVGQLPPCLLALLVRDADCNDDGDTVDAEDITPRDFGDADGVLEFGWRGPYLVARNGQYADGWGASGGPDFGWLTALTGLGPVTEITVTSLGRDRLAGDTSGDGLYDADQTTFTATALDTSVGLATTAISVSITNAAGPDRSVCMALAYPDPTDPDGWLHHVADGGPFVIGGGATRTLNFAAAGGVIPIGARPLMIYDEAEANVAACAIAPGFEDDVLSAPLARRTLVFAPRIVPTAAVFASLP